ncbi:uncharacterized protein LOC110734709 [Chenopodium quinoa]|uniref:uncharacterized protein LOC110734709 n=1 Tax=Chenopodium quinoa TaxID=63459 RepID=UPI000B78A4B1|nr:uncharacterized protein LOC110734709 [Chenopodium quinoa]
MRGRRKVTASASTSESSDDLPPLEDSEEEERKKWSEKEDPFKIHVSTKDMVQMEENLKSFSQMHPLGDGRSFKHVADGEDTQEVLCDIRKELAEKHGAAVKAKGGEVGKTFEKSLKWAREEPISTLNKTKKSASALTPGASARNQQMRIWGRNETIGDVQKHAKAILEAVSKKDKNAIPGIETFNLEHILSLLAEASKIQQLEADLKTANQRVSDAETAQKGAEEAKKKAEESLKKVGEVLKKAQADFGTLQGASEEKTLLKTKVKKLEKEAAQAQIKFVATLEAEQNCLVDESDVDNDVRMKIAWVALYPEQDYGIWALAHRYAEDVVYLREKGEPEPDSFDAWASANTELPAPELLGPGEAQEIPSYDEEDQEEPPAGHK